MSNDFNNITSSINGTVSSKDAMNIDGIAQTVDTGVTVGHNKDSMNNLGVDRNFDVISSQKTGE
jgi:hypothetical protein